MKTGCGLTAQGVLDRIAAGSLKPMIQLPYSPEMLQYQVLRVPGEILKVGDVDLDDGVLWEANRWLNTWFGRGAPVDENGRVTVLLVSGNLEVSTGKRFGGDGVGFDHFSGSALVTGFLVVTSSELSLEFSVSPDPDTKVGGRVVGFSDSTNDYGTATEYGDLPRLSRTDEDALFFPLAATAWKPISPSIWDSGVPTWSWVS